MLKLNLDQRSWQSFLDKIVEPNNYEESCAWLFVDYPFDDLHKVYVFQVKNVGLKGGPKRWTFGPDKKELQKVKKVATQRELTKIGNIHTHIITPNDEREFSGMKLSDVASPSDVDLKFARKFNDIIRGVIAVRFTKDNVKGEIVGISWHTKYGYIMQRHGREKLFAPQ